MQKLLAANRGEIAIRIMRAAAELGLRTATIYSQQDRLSLHRFKADEAYLVGADQGPVAAYLDIPGIIGQAKEHGVDAIHPGYGFLAENSAMARACAEAGIVFVGPPAEILDALGDKVSARRLAQEAGIPVIPGHDAPITDVAAAQRAAAAIGFPLMVKAAFGGGGRGLRVVHRPEDLSSQIEEAQKEAQGAFGNGAVFLERYIRRARHIEVQIFADAHGNVRHLHERDCSVQRRHQKVVEVAPAPNLDDGVRRQLHEAALTLARASGYVNAGTVEFLLDADSNEWFFIEVNPPHPSGAHGHGGRPGPGPGAIPDPRRAGHRPGRRAPGAAPGRRHWSRAASPCSAASRPRIQRTTSRPTMGGCRTTARRPAPASGSTARPPTAGPSSAPTTTPCSSR